MKAIVLGIAHRKGISTKNGPAREFDFATVYTLRPIEVVNREKFQQVGHGFEVVEAKADEGALPQFAGRKFPAEMELITEARPSAFGNLELVVVGVK